MFGHKKHRIPKIPNWLLGAPLPSVSHQEIKRNRLQFEGEISAYKEIPRHSLPLKNVLSSQENHQSPRATNQAFAQDHLLLRRVIQPAFPNPHKPVQWLSRSLFQGPRIPQ